MSSKAVLILPFAILVSRCNMELSITDSVLCQTCYAMPVILRTPPAGVWLSSALVMLVPGAQLYRVQRMWSGVCSAWPDGRFDLVWTGPGRPLAVHKTLCRPTGRGGTPLDRQPLKRQDHLLWLFDSLSLSLSLSLSAALSNRSQSNCPFVVLVNTKLCCHLYCLFDSLKKTEGDWWGAEGRLTSSHHHLTNTGVTLLYLFCFTRSSSDPMRDFWLTFSLCRGDIRVFQM